MHCPSVFTRVRVSGRKDEFVVVRVDHPACLADLSPLLDRTIIEKDVPFALLFETWNSDATHSASYIHDCRLTEIREVLRSSHVAITQSQTTLADLHDSIRSTVQAIGSSQKLIVETDRLIAAARFGGFIEQATGDTDV